MPNEADTRRTYIVPKLHTSGWEDDSIVEQLPLTPGRIVPIGDRHTRKDGLRPDYGRAMMSSILDKAFKGEL
jgi:type I site-specific restriction endonuclease